MILWFATLPYYAWIPLAGLSLFLHFKLKKWARSEFIRRRAHNGFISLGVLSGDGRHVLSRSVNTTMNYEALKYWDIESGRCLQTLEEGTIAEAPFHESNERDGPDWYLIAGILLSALFLPTQLVGIYLLYKLIARVKRVPTLKTAGESPRASAVACLFVSDDGHYALTGSSDAGVRFYDLVKGSRLRTFKGHTASVSSVCLSSNGRYVLSGSEDSTVRLWDATTGRCLRTLTGHEGEVTCVSFSKDVQYVISGGKDKVVRLWQTDTGRCLRTCTGHPDIIVSVQINRGCDLIASSSKDGTLRFWDIPRQGVEVFPLHVSRIHNTTEVIEEESRADDLLRRAERAIHEGDFSGALTWATEARQIPGFERTRRNLDQWEHLSLYCQRAGIRDAWLVKIFGENVGAVASVCLRSDGKMALSGYSSGQSSDDATLRLWDVSTGACLKELKNKDTVSALCMSVDGHYALSGSLDGSLRLWDLKTGNHLKTLWGHTGAVTSICLSADASLAVSGSADKTLRFWEVETGKCLRAIVSRDPGSLNAVCLSLSSHFALSAGERGVLRLWELNTGRSILSMRGHTQPIKSICLSSDGRFALTGSSDCTLRLWGLKTGECLRKFEGHIDAVTSVCFMEDGRFAISSSLDGTLRLWEVESGECLNVFEGHSGSLLCVSVSASGRYALSCSTEQTLLLWEIDWKLKAIRPADWDEGARTYLEDFIYLHTPLGGDLPADRKASQQEIKQALTRSGLPAWSEQDFQFLIRSLQWAGYGWLRAEGVKRELLAMTAAREGDSEFLDELNSATKGIFDLPKFYFKYKSLLRTHFLPIILILFTIVAPLITLTLIYHLVNDDKRAKEIQHPPETNLVSPFLNTHWERYKPGSSSLSLELPGRIEHFGAHIPFEDKPFIRQHEQYTASVEGGYFDTAIAYVEHGGRLKFTPQELFSMWKTETDEVEGMLNPQFETKPTGRVALVIVGNYERRKQTIMVKGLIVVKGSEFWVIIIKWREIWPGPLAADAQEAAQRIINSVQY